MSVGPQVAGTIFARTVLAIAADIEAAENAIKQAIADAAGAGDLDRVQDIVTRWQRMPAVEVMRADLPTPPPQHADGLATSAPVEVTEEGVGSNGSGGRARRAGG